MTDAEREAEIRRCREGQTTPLQRNPWGSGVYGWGVAEIDCLLRLLDEARAEIARLIKLNEQLGKVNAGLRQKLTDLEFPPDETERAPPEETANP